jgi:hypothetical protein
MVMRRRGSRLATSQRKVRARVPVVRSSLAARARGAASDRFDRLFSRDWASAGWSDLKHQHVLRDRHLTVEARPRLGLKVDAVALGVEVR